MILLVWAGATTSGAGLGLAVALWVVGGVLSVGLSDDQPADAPVDTTETEGQLAPTQRPSGSTERDDQRSQTAADALATLREQYARGELTEAQFEHRVERLLATDTAPMDDAVRTLRARYARGELSDEQFDRKLDRLTDTTTLENATDTYEPEQSFEN